jgi:hypothetical protein
MRDCELTLEEANVLREVLNHAANELDIEIRRTDTPDFKEQLKRRRSVLEQIQVKVGSAPAMA